MFKTNEYVLVLVTEAAIPQRKYILMGPAQSQIVNIVKSCFLWLSKGVTEVHPCCSGSPNPPQLAWDTKIT